MNYGAVGISDRLDGKLGLGMLAEFIGTFTLCSRSWAWPWIRARTGRLGPLAIGAALGVGVMVIGPLTGAGFNPARAFGPALVSGEWGGAGDFLLAYVAGPLHRVRGGRGGRLLQPLHRPGRQGAGGPGARRLRPAGGGS